MASETQSGAARHELSAPGDGQRLDLFIAQSLDLSRTQAATLIANGNVAVNGKAERSSYKPNEGDVVAVEIPPPESRPIIGEDIPLVIAYEDADLLVVDKAAGMVVHPAPGNWTGTLVNALKGRDVPLSHMGDEDREGIVHRLDKETSGLLLVAKNERAHRILSAALQRREVMRRYAVLSWGHLDKDTVTVDKPLGRDPRDRTKMAVVSGGREARTDFVRLARFDAVDLLRAQLHSGRTHQIRIHLSSIGHPVVGDDTYGGGGGRKLVGIPPKRHFLHAARLRFKQPTTGEMVDLRSSLPPDLTASLEMAAGRDSAFADNDPLEYFGFFRDDT